MSHWDIWAASSIGRRFALISVHSPSSTRTAAPLGTPLAPTTRALRRWALLDLPDAESSKYTWTELRGTGLAYLSMVLTKALAGLRRGMTRPSVRKSHLSAPPPPLVKEDELRSGPWTRIVRSDAAGSMVLTKDGTSSPSADPVVILAREKAPHSPISASMASLL